MAYVGGADFTYTVPIITAKQSIFVPIAFAGQISSEDYVLAAEGTTVTSKTPLIYTVKATFT